MSLLIKMAKEHKLAAKQGTEKCFKPVRARSVLRWSGGIVW